jgi:hypothetical protein
MVEEHSQAHALECPSLRRTKEHMSTPNYTTKNKIRVYL